MQEKFIVAWGGAKPIICENNGFSCMLQNKICCLYVFEGKEPYNMATQDPF
jgi:hypothetical protein